MKIKEENHFMRFEEDFSDHDQKCFQFDQDFRLY
jgi:hypothetical protein